MNKRIWDGLTGPDRMVILDRFDFTDLTRQNYKAQVHQWTHFTWEELPYIIRRTLAHFA